jgi:CheY-like chemotaxis protein
VKKILVIDDDPSISTIASKRLQSEEIQTLTASDGAEGLRMVREARPDVVLLDLMMPKVHGFTVIREIRENPSLSNVKIVVTSAKSFSGDIETARRLGADRCLPKPCNLQELWQVVAELLGTRLPGFTVRFWGTRGSIATPGQGTVKYGGNTSCTEGERIYNFSSAWNRKVSRKGVPRADGQRLFPNSVERDEGKADLPRIGGGRSLGGRFSSLTFF